ncbi:MAG: phosphoglucomutase/phosphomannomutase family protein [Chlorobiota bacterium]|nr:phosphoglucomutase/phosphomannomutase family protein [Chlorobiota bacterium]QQS65509.1 MAG: phosphoglucomutase/phosphomannomutase family protein [Chlorobiota bacterium]
MSIIFGTDGWRGVIADDFTFANVAIVARSAHEFYNNHKNSANGIVIGYDARFHSDNFAKLVSRIFATEGMKVYLSDSISSTPQISLFAKENNLSGGIIITASHNPPEYNGFKLKADFGGPSIPEDIAQIQKNIIWFEEHPSKTNRLIDSYEDLVSKNKIIITDIKKPYIEYLKKKIKINDIKKAGFKILYDPMYGSGINTFDQLFPNADQIHNEHNPTFGNLGHPEPIEECLGELIKEVKKGKYSIGIATDGDADRLGVVDEKGNYIDSHRVFTLILKYLFEDKKLKGIVAKTVSLTTMINDYCRKNEIKMKETPIGFKHIAKLMTTENVVIGGEESGGFGTCLHIPERDGIFNALLLLEMMAKRKKTLSQLSKELDKEFGPHFYKRVDMHTTIENRDAIISRVKKGVEKFGTQRVIASSALDGFKFFVPQGWLLIRASGTEPVIRYYAESVSIEKVDELLKGGMDLK